MKNIFLSMLLMAVAFVGKAQCISGTISGPTDITIGYTGALTSSGTSGGTWTSSNPSVATVDPSSGDFTGLTTGSATITYSLGGSCSGTFSTYATNVTSGISGHVKTCTGDTTTLHPTVSGGTWTSSNTSVATIGSTDGIVHGIASGSTTISYSFTVSSVSYVATWGFNVVGVPTLGSYSGPTSTCQGYGPLVGVTGSSVTWLSRNPSMLTINPFDSSNCYAIGDSVGSTFLIYKSSFCSLVSDSVNFQVYPTPVLTGTITGRAVGGYLCNADTATFAYTDTAVGTWSVYSTYSSTIDSTTGQFTAAGSTAMDYGLVVYTVTTSHGCSSDINASVYISPTPLPGLDSIVGPDTVRMGTTYPFTSTEYLPYGYFDDWFISSGSAASITWSGVLTPISNGVITVVHEIRTDCGNVYQSKTVYVSLPATAPSTPYFSSYSFEDCSGPTFLLSVPPHSSPLELVTHFGDGHSDTTTLHPATGIFDTSLSHFYMSTGTYTIKQVIFNSSGALDSLSFSQAHTICHDISLSFYFDGNGNCIYDSSSEILNGTPLWVEVDSNSVPIDTISATSGVYYTTMGSTGDIYSFRTIALDTMVRFSCPSTGVIYDTMGTAYSSVHQYIALSCASSAGFNLYAHSTYLAGRHTARGTIIVYNSSCTPHSATATVYISPKYMVDTTSGSITPTPASVTTNSITWNLSGLATSATPATLHYNMQLAGYSTTWLTPGDTVHTRIVITPTVGDADSTNNIIVSVDTVKSSYDPNHISVSPEGGILNGTKLHYAIEFENDGNDTARNVYIMDTLSDNLNPYTLAVTGASASMNIAIIHAGGHNIVKFDFPGINLPDSSHHGAARGVVMYDIKARTGLADGTGIYSHAGIYFDDNEVVLTDSAVNSIVVPQLTIATPSGDSICGSNSLHFTAAPHSVPNSHYHWWVNATTSGTDSVGLTTSVSPGDTVKCVMTAIMDDSIYSTSNRIIFFNGSAPSAATLSGASTVCAGTSTTLIASASGGSWTSINPSLATVAAGVVTGVTSGTDTIVYNITNSCGTAISTKIMTINPAPVAGSVSGVTSACIGATTTLTATASGGTWSSTYPSIATVSGGVVTGVAAGIDTVIYSITNSCGTATVRTPVTIASSPSAGTITGATHICIGSATTLSASISGGTWTSTNPSVATVAGGVVTAVASGIDTIYYNVTNSCGTAAASIVMTIETSPVAGTISGSSTACVGSSTALTTSGAGGSWSSTNPSIATVSTSGNVIGVAIGADTIVYTATNSCGSVSASASISVFLAPSSAALSGTTTVCTGAATTFTASATGGTWSSSNTSIATVTGGVITGVAAGVDTIIYTISNACGTASSMSAITVIALPFAGTISGASSVCAGSTITLSTTGSGGSWSSTTTSLATVSGGVVSGVAAGVDTIKYIATNSCGVSAASTVITVNPMPSAGSISGSTAVCIGSNTTLTSSASGGTWTSSSPTIATVSGGVISGLAIGTAIITYSVTNSCGTATALSAITVNPLPSAGSVTGVSSLCVGSSATFSASVSGGTWSASSAIVSLSGADVTGVSAGTTTLYYVVSNSCGADTATATIIVIAAPSPGVIIAPKDSICLGGTVTMTNATSGGTWSSSNAGIASVSTGGVVSAVMSGTVTISYTVSNTCGANSATHSLYVRPAGDCPDEIKIIPGIATLDISVYPNPGNGTFIIELPDHQGEVSISITDVEGKIVHQLIAKNQHELKVPVDASNLASGIYFVQVELNGSIYRKKIVIM